MRRVLEDIVAEHPGAVEQVELLGAGATGFSGEVVNAARRALAGLVRVDAATAPARGLWPELFEGIRAAAGDPDRELCAWVRHGWPLGIQHELKPQDVFPAVSEDTAAIEASRVFARWHEEWPTPIDQHTNYSSFYEEQEAALEDLRRVVRLGYADEVATWEEVERLTGPGAIPTKLAVITKLRKDGTKKVRIIVDMRRSGINGKVKIRERLVLPRLSDAAEDGVEMMCQAKASGKRDAPGDAGRNLEFFVIDFEDAFYAMRLRPEERKYVVARGDSSWFVFRSVAFGIASGPILWGRTAAFAARVGQCMFAPWELRLQVYVDDPLASVTGETPRVRAGRFCLLLLFWAALGFRLAWPKGQRGRSVEWIGGDLVIREAGIEVRLTESRTRQLITELQAVSTAAGALGHQKALRLAGTCSWVASLVPRARPFVAHLWGAITEARQRGAPKRADTRRRPKGLVFKRQIQFAITWLLRLVSREQRLARLFSTAAKLGTNYIRVRTDASPFGLGGILVDHEDDVVAFWFDSLREEELLRFNAQVGDPAFQAEWELLAVVISLDVFRAELCQRHAIVQVESDSQAALGAALKLSSMSPLMNVLAAELALRLEAMGCDAIVGRHVPGVLNFIADALSRVAQGKPLPSAVLGAERRSPPRRDASFWLCWPDDCSGLP